MFLVGLTAFIAASLACGIPPNAPSLVAARIAAGGTAALAGTPYDPANSPGETVLLVR
jgi:MFS family permease